MMFIRSPSARGRVIGFNRPSTAQGRVSEVIKASKREYKNE